MFQKATRQQSKLRLCVSGPSGSGKTYGSLKISESIKGDGRIAFIDTENGSASLYAKEFDFDVLNLEPPFTPQRFVDAIKGAEDAGYKVIVIDSATHEWEGSGGCLEMNEMTARNKFKGNTWSAWSDTNKEHQKFINAIVLSKAHIICTARSKTETAQEGKRIMRLGTKLVQRDNFEYEFTLALDIMHDGHYANAIKDRTGLFMGKDAHVIDDSTGSKILDWLNDGQSVDELMKTHLEDIESASSEAALLDIARAAYQAMKPHGDDYLNKIIVSKDKRIVFFNQSEEENNIAVNENYSEIQDLPRIDTTTFHEINL